MLDFNRIHQNNLYSNMLEQAMPNLLKKFPGDFFVKCLDVQVQVK